MTGGSIFNAHVWHNVINNSKSKIIIIIIIIIVVVDNHTFQHLHAGKPSPIPLCLWE